MPRSQTVQTLLFAGACALGATLFVGGLNLRDRTDTVARVTRRADRGEGLIASRDGQGTQIPLGDFYSALSDLLKHEYVEPITNDQKLASGAVRGMVLSLGDPRSMFMDADEFRAFLNAREGRYEGIGVEFELRGAVSARPRATAGTAEPADDPRDAILSGHVPYLAATVVVPGGPADRAGVRPGDVVAEIDGHWVVDDAEIVRFENARRAFVAKKIPFAVISKLQKSLHDKAERALMPAKAKDRLALGKDKEVKVVWKRAGVARATTMTKAESKMTAFGVQNGALIMRFDAQTPGRLRAAIKDKNSVTLDLRNNVDGDFDSMRKCLAVLAPDGVYGALVTKRKEPSTRLVVKGGNARPPKMTLLVDRSTRGPAAIMAQALSSRRLATVVGGPTGNDLSVREVVHLPDGTGYTLVIGEYKPTVTATKVALSEVGS